MKVPRAKPDLYRASELLHQSARRAAREATGPYGAEAARGAGPDDPRL